MPLTAEYVRKLADMLSEHCNQYPPGTRLHELCHNCAVALHAFARELARWRTRE